jgi:hypothetical protein
MHTRIALATTALALALVAAAAAPAHNSGMGPPRKALRPVFAGYYDGHKDLYLNTDVSDKAQAAEMHINYAPMLAKRLPMMATPEIYIVQGKAAAGQLVVFGSEPGEPNYNPIWHEVIVTWKAAATPQLLVKDDQIKDLAKQGMLTMRHTHIQLNCPIIHVGTAKAGGGGGGGSGGGGYGG